MTPAVAKPQSLGAGVTREECSNLILAFARVLYVNGESTHHTLGVAQRLSNCLGFRATIFPRWGELEVQSENTETKFISAIEAAPSGVDMDRVASTLRTVEELCEGRLAPSNAMDAISRIAKAPPVPTWLFTLAAAVGAVALAVLFGVRHLTASALIFGSGAAGVILRRTLARHSTNLFLQPFSAALVAGIVGALAVRYDLSSSLRLVAVCPCMVLVPGPHFLNGMLDLIRVSNHPALRSVANQSEVSADGRRVQHLSRSLKRRAPFANIAHASALMSGSPDFAALSNSLPASRCPNLHHITPQRNM